MGDVIVSDPLLLSGATATRLLATDADKRVVPVGNLASWVAGTANRVTVTDDTDGTITLSAPQDLHTSAEPQFAGVVAAYVAPAENSTTAFQVRRANKTNVVLYVDTISDMVIVNGRTASTSFFSNRQTINDDSIFVMGLPVGITRGMLILTNSGTSSSNRHEVNAFIAFDVTSGRINVLTQLASRVDAKTTALTGTDGTDGQFSVSVYDTALTFENRIGAAIIVSALIVA
jgi:hypothetical protein